MKNFLLKSVVVILLAGTAFYVYANYIQACGTLSYAVGDVDPRFGITSEEFVELATQSESVWEGPMQREFFKYDPSAKFKVNLVFDHRQQRTIDERNSRTEIQTQEEQYRNLVNQYENLLAQHKQANIAYEADVAAYDERLKKYNEQVDYWNKNGGAPSKEYTALQKEKQALQQIARQLESERQSLNKTVSSLNTMASQINVKAKALNLDVDAYNGTFGTTREFDQGSYTGSAINIYQFNENDDLKLVMAHEFGHALGMDHIDDPLSIMYYLMDKQNIKNLQASEADLDALRKSCRIR